MTLEGVGRVPEVVLETPRLRLRELSHDDYDAVHAYGSDPDRFRQGYDDLLSNAGIDSAEELGARFDLDVTDQACGESSRDGRRARSDEDAELGLLAVDPSSRTSPQPDTSSQPGPA